MATIVYYGPAGGAAVSNSRMGEEAIAVGATTVVITFSVPYTGLADYYVLFSFGNEIDSPPLILEGVVTARTLTTFTVTLSGTTPTANYIMYWRTFK